MSQDDTLRLGFAGLAPARVDRLIAGFGGEAGVVRAIASGRVGVPRRVREAVEVSAAARREQLAAIGVDFVTDLPERLSEIPGSPRWLFVHGKLSSAGGCVAVVGSRKASTYGLAFAASIGASLAAEGRVVVSGLARGIDGAAHRGMLESAGVGIGVLGSGIDVLYPRSNRHVAAEIVGSGGAIVSEFPPGTPPEPWRFPCRNRIIAGLSPVVVVVEAAARSGALITARLALEYGRDVLALPGDIDRPTSAGCNLLVRDGAFPVTSLDELSEVIASIMGPSAARGADTGAPFDGAVGRVPVPLDVLVGRVGRPAAEVLAEVARLEAAGRLVVEAGLVSVR